MINIEIPKFKFERQTWNFLFMIHPILLRLSVAIYWSVRHLFYMYHMMKMTECGNFYAEKHTKQMKQS